jgi:predicted permease
MREGRRLAWASALVRAAAPLVPARLRAEWIAEWDAELAALADLPESSRRPIRRALGALPDAFWLRQRSIADIAVIDEIRIALRQVHQHAGFATTAAGILALGLGATVAMFCVTTQVLLRPLPYPDAERIVTVWETRAPDMEPLDVAPGNFLDWRERAQAFAHLSGVEPWSLDIAGNPRPEIWFAAKVTEGFFETFGLAPLAGRFFMPEDYRPGHDRVIVIGEAFWRQRFGADPTVVGRVVRTTEGQLYTIVGIAPAALEPRMHLTASGYRDVWLPKVIEEHEPRIRESGYWAAVGRLKPGISLEAAQAEMDALARQLAAEHPRAGERPGVRVLPLREHLVGDIRLAVALLAGSVVMVLLITCVNVANLLLARGAARGRELAVRAALGAGPRRLARQLLLEATVVAALGGLGGCLVAAWALAALGRLGPRTVPWIDTLHLDWRALVFAALATAAAALVAGALPAWRLTRVSLATAGRATSTPDRLQHRLRVALVVAEVAMALVLLAGAGLLIRSFVNLLRVDPGFERDNVVVAQVFAWDYNPSPAQLRTFFDTALARLEALPAVQQAGAVSAMPFIEANINIEGLFSIAGRPQPPDGSAPRAHLTVATPGYFRAMQIPLVAGRYFDDSDRAETRPVALISETLARRHWPPGDDPLGDRVRTQVSGRSLEAEIVGIVGSLRHDALDSGPRGEIFLPFAQRPFGSMTFVVRTADNASALLEEVRAAIWSANPSQPIYRSATLDELVDRTLTPRRFALSIAMGFAGIALLLAVAGVYGVLTAVLAGRLRELGIRVALGAGRRQIIGLVVGRALGLAGAGLAIGMAGSLVTGRLLQSVLFDTRPGDPATLAAAAGAMLVAIGLATVGPARRAVSTDPVVVLRVE